MSPKKITLLAAVALSALGAGACAIHTEPEPVTGYVELSSAPTDVSAYPQTTYEGRTVYYVNNRWMYPERGRWVYYRHEPDVLVRQRRVIQQAPPAYPQGYQQGYPPGRYQSPAVAPPAGSPPAVRVQ